MRLATALALVASLLLLSTSAASADPSAPAALAFVVPSAARPAEPSVASSSRSRKSPATALMLSAGITAAGILGLVVVSQVNNDGSEVDELAIGIPAVAALVIGPSVGHWYSRRILHPGMAVRVGGVAIATLGSYYQVGCDGCTGNEKYILLGLGVYAAGVIYEIVDAPRSAKAYNRRHGLDVQVAPTYARTATDAVTGLAIAGRF